MAEPNLHFQRFEFKYYLPKRIADKIIPALLSHLKWDNYAIKSDDNFYQVNSLYFDSPNYACFWDKESGVAKRKKLRLRFYGESLTDNSHVFIEIKRKHDALVTKDRLKLKAADCDNKNLTKRLKGLLDLDKENAFLHELIWFIKSNSLRPKLFITYKRKALVGKRDSKLRVTFDYDIRTMRMNRLDNRCKKLKSVFPDGVVLEIKYNNVLPAWLHKIICQYQLDRIAFSKYCNSLRKVLPQFDDNNYSLT